MGTAGEHRLPQVLEGRSAGEGSQSAELGMPRAAPGFTIQTSRSPGGDSEPPGIGSAWPVLTGLAI